jgi:hypothetical protein
VLGVIEVPACHVIGDLEWLIVEDKILLNSRSDRSHICLESLYALVRPCRLPAVEFDEAALNHEPKVGPSSEWSLQ